MKWQGLAIAGWIVSMCLFVAACGTTSPSTSAPHRTVIAAPTLYPDPLTQPWPIDRVRRGADPTSVLIDISGVPAANATGRCAATVTQQANEGPLVVGVNIEVLARLLKPFPGCATTTRTLEVRLKQPLGTRDVIATGTVSAQGGRFIAKGQDYLECTPPGCNPEDIPIPADCDNLRQWIAKRDIPAHFQMAGPCHEPYAAVVVDFGAGACPQGGDGPNPCAGQRLTRQFWYSDGKTWRLLVGNKQASCVDAHRVLPAFPLSLCDEPAWRSAVS